MSRPYALVEVRDGVATVAYGDVDIIDWGEVGNDREYAKGVLIAIEGHPSVDADRIRDAIESVWPGLTAEAE